MLNNNGFVKLLVQKTVLDKVPHSNIRPGTILNMTIEDIIAATDAGGTDGVYPVYVQVIQGFGNVFKQGKRLTLFLLVDGTVSVLI